MRAKYLLLVVSVFSIIALSYGIFSHRFDGSNSLSSSGISDCASNIIPNPACTAAQNATISHPGERDAVITISAVILVVSLLGLWKMLNAKAK